MGMLGQWRIQGRDPPIFLDQTDTNTKRAEKLSFETAPPPRIWRSGSVRVQIQAFIPWVFFLIPNVPFIVCRKSYSECQNTSSWQLKSSTPSLFICIEAEGF